MDIAFVCRYGHQDVRRILGIERPLTPIELALFVRALQEHVETEFKERIDIVPNTND